MQISLDKVQILHLSDPVRYPLLGVTRHTAVTRFNDCRRLVSSSCSLRQFETIANSAMVPMNAALS